jgi:hypothetical protein
MNWMGGGRGGTGGGRSWGRGGGTEGRVGPLGAVKLHLEEKNAKY